MRHPVGTRVECPFWFTFRELTPSELEAVEAGGRLPSGVGFDPEVVFAEYEPPGSDTPLMISGSSVHRDEAGLYHVVIPYEDQGTYKWRGIGQAVGGTPVAATPDVTDYATRSF